MLHINSLQSQPALKGLCFPSTWTVESSRLFWSFLLSVVRRPGRLNLFKMTVGFGFFEKAIPHHVLQDHSGRHDLSEPKLDIFPSNDTQFGIQKVGFGHAPLVSPGQRCFLAQVQDGIHDIGNGIDDGHAKTKNDFNQQEWHGCQGIVGTKLVEDSFTGLDIFARTLGAKKAGPQGKGPMLDNLDRIGRHARRTANQACDGQHKGQVIHHEGIVGRQVKTFTFAAAILQGNFGIILRQLFRPNPQLSNVPGQNFRTLRNAPRMRPGVAQKGHVVAEVRGKAMLEPGPGTRQNMPLRCIQPTPIHTVSGTGHNDIDLNGKIVLRFGKVIAMITWFMKGNLIALTTNAGCHGNVNFAPCRGHGHNHGFGGHRGGITARDIGHITRHVQIVQHLLSRMVAMLVRHIFQQHVQTRRPHAQRQVADNAGRGHGFQDIVGQQIFLMMQMFQFIDIVVKNVIAIEPRRHAGIMTTPHRDMLGFLARRMGDIGRRFARAHHQDSFARHLLAGMVFGRMNNFTRKATKNGRHQGFLIGTRGHHQVIKHMLRGLVGQDVNRLAVGIGRDGRQGDLPLFVVIQVSFVNGRLQLNVGIQIKMLGIIDHVIVIFLLGPILDAGITRGKIGISHKHVGRGQVQVFKRDIGIGRKDTTNFDPGIDRHGINAHLP